MICTHMYMYTYVYACASETGQTVCYSLRAMSWLDLHRFTCSNKITGLAMLVNDLADTFSFAS